MVTSISELNLHSENVVRFTASVGDLIRLCPPVVYPPEGKPSDDSPATQYLAGFTILKPDLGEFEGMFSGSNMCVKYRHKKSGKQIIQFASIGLGDVKFYAVIDGITIHDHASIPQGGPAFATYYVEPPSVPVEEGG